MKRNLALESSKSVDQQVMLMGWVNSRRDHGGVIFIDIRDESGIVQLTIHPDHQAAFEIAEGVRDEYVLKASGKAINREAGLINKDIATGEVEIVVEELEILNKSDPLPFSVSKDSQTAGEETRLTYRYIDLRRDKMQQMLVKRSKFNYEIHKFMQDADFVEVSTPILANSSPEGARDYLVPSRMHPGKFYALPQAPQQFKQLLMVGGIPRYYQIAPCFRDEDPRADRHQGDFYQLDLEVAFATDGEEIREITEPLIKQLVTDFGGKKLQSTDIPRIPYREAMDKYGTDQPDLRYGMELVELSEELKNTEFGVFANTVKDGGVVKAIAVKGGASLSRKEIDGFTEIAKQEGAGGLAYIFVENGEAKSPIAKFLSSEEIKSIISKTDAKDGDAIFFGVDKRDVANKVLGRLRNEFADRFELKDDNVVALAWIVDFPFYEWDEKRKKIDFGHNPFSMPKGGLAEFEKEYKLSIMADQYDMVANGYEICSGAVRNYNPEVMYRAFEVVGFTREQVDEKFGAMIKAFKYGAPPHAGCAFGLDRIFMVLMSEPNIREVIAFPKNGSGVDLMMQSPSSVSPEQLSELSIEVVEQTEK
jgi:aspartyl-tRNA synthetase